MVSTLTFLFIILNFLVSFITPVVVYRFAKKKYNISFRPVIVGVFIWFFAIQVFEKTLHIFVLQNTQLSQMPFLYAAYGGIAAGIFEEIGRYIGFIFLLKQYRKWKDGFAYGIGHGGIEAVLLGCGSAVQLLIFANMVNQGSLYSLSKTLSPQVVASIQQTFTQSSFVFLFIGVERVCAFIIQLALSLLVLHSVKEKKIHLLGLAILLHAFVDFVPALYQSHVVSIFIAGAVILIATVFSLHYLKFLSRQFHME
jgi:uncharacterized membrane protein YhfC